MLPLPTRWRRPALISEPLPEFADDRDRIVPGDRVVLVVEDDPTFGGLLLGLARSAGLKGVLSTAGSGTLALARKLMPDAITLDLGLSDIDGWVLFDLLRHDPKTSGIPIHVISGADDLDALARKGATSVSTKPVSSDELTRVFEDIHSDRLRTQRNVLVADADPDRRLSLVDAIRDGVTSVTAIARLAADAGRGRVRRLRRDRARPRTLGKGQCADAGARSTRRLGDAASRLLIFAPSFEALDQSMALNPAVADVPRAENLAQLALLMSAVLPGEDDGGRFGRGARASRHRRPGRAPRC